MRELEDEIEDLKTKLDKTEYIIQYKEKIWTYLEREIRKVVSEDSDLMKKVQAETKILTECLATTKVSNVVKQNDNLVADHTQGCDKLQEINERLKRELLAYEMPRATQTVSSQRKREQLKQMKGSLFSTSGSGSAFEVINPDQRLHTLVTELAKLVDAQRSRLDLLDEESKHFKQNAESMTKEYDRIKVQFEQLAERLAH